MTHTGSNDNHIIAFFKKFFYIFLHDFQDLNLGGERVASKLLPRLKEFFD